MSSADNNGNEPKEAIPLGKRLESLNASFGEDIMKEMKEVNHPKKVPKAGSLEVLLAQYLETNNTYQIESVIGISDIKTVEQTTQRLDIKYVFPFLNMLVLKLESNPRRGADLLRWIKAILYYHSSYLMSVPDLKKRLILLNNLLNTRTASYKKLIKLNGRLDLVLTHARSLLTGDIDFTQAQIPQLEVDEGNLQKDADEDTEEETVEVSEDSENEDKEIDSDEDIQGMETESDSEDE